MLKQSPHRRPGQIKRSPAPPCHASDARTRKRFMLGYRWFANAYRQAAARLRAGELDVQFPENCFPPPLAFKEPAPAPG